MIEVLEPYKRQLERVDEKLSDPAIMSDISLYKDLMRERSHLEPIVNAYNEMESLSQQIRDAEQMLEEESDSELIALTREELKDLREQKEDLEQKSRILLIPPDPMEGKNIIMEIRAGTGGDEAALFAADLFKMYSHFAEQHRWKVEIISANETGIGGFKEIIYSISGTNVYGNLKYESGVHRVQRVPETESGGRIHTSAVTVAVLPEAEETDIEIKQEELKVDVMRAGGPGGQSVNTTDSAVRLTHLPTGLVVICQDEKSQIKNKAKALRVLRSRLYDLEEERKAKERSDNRKSQVGTGDRSERIRTYNFPQNRITDHRINLTLYKLELALAGDIGEVIEQLKISEAEQALQDLNI